MITKLKQLYARLARHFMQLPKRRRLRLLFVIGLVLFIYWFIPPVWRLEKGPITITRWPKSGEKIFVIGPGQATWVPIKKVSRHVLNAFIAAEDGKFYQHNGFDISSIISSYEANRKHNKIVRGGSTISQQVVKMAFLSNDRNYIRKAREAVGTILLEQLLEKEKILEWYLNLAEFGDGVFGIKAAAKHYFDTKPELLTIQHGAHLALVLPSPNKWSKGLRSKRLTEFGQKRYTNIINNMFFAGMITNVLRMTALATGDFGRPVRAFSNLQRKSKSDEPLNYDDEDLSKAAEKDEREADASLDILPKAIELPPSSNASQLSQPDLQNADSTQGPTEQNIVPQPLPESPLQGSEAQSISPQEATPDPDISRPLLKNEPPSLEDDVKNEP